MDIGGPYNPGVPVTDRTVAKHQWPRYMLVGSFIPFSDKEVKVRYEQEVKDRQAMGLEGPVQLETATKPKCTDIAFCGINRSKK